MLHCQRAAASIARRETPRQKTTPRRYGLPHTHRHPIAVTLTIARVAVHYEPQAPDPAMQRATESGKVGRRDAYPSIALEAASQLPATGSGQTRWASANFSGHARPQRGPTPIFSGNLLAQRNGRELMRVVLRRR